MGLLPRILFTAWAWVTCSLAIAQQVLGEQPDLTLERLLANWQFEANALPGGLERLQLMLQFLHDDAHTEFAAWKNFLRNVSGYGMDDHARAIEQLNLPYLQAIAQLGRRIEACNEEKNLHSRNWIEALQRHYGRDFIADNKKTIIQALAYLSFRNSENCLADAQARVIYEEARYRSAAAYYFERFRDFYDTQDNTSQDKLRAFKTYVEELEAMFDKASFCALLAGGEVQLALHEAAAYRGDPKLLDWLSRQQDLMRPFSVFKAIEELEALIASAEELHK